MATIKSWLFRTRFAGGQHSLPLVGSLEWEPLHVLSQWQSHNLQHKWLSFNAYYLMRLLRVHLQDTVHLWFLDDRKKKNLYSIHLVDHDK